ncbi:PPOX class F420-dependent oxidoreductase [Actinoplanes teichomyceticus]|nr:PPOX class F420-dependent oxidoreductase [Actinoplanes teichomyceticus]
MPKMSREEALAFLTAGTRTGKLATVSPAGVPHVVPIWFVADGDTLLFTTGHSSIKARNLRADPRAALSVDVQDFPYHYVSVQGRVGLQEGAPDLLDWTTRIAQRYVPADQAEAYGRRNAVPEELLCRLSIERITGFSDIAL